LGGGREGGKMVMMSFREKKASYNKTGIWEIKGEKLLLREGFRIRIHLLLIRIWIGSSIMMNTDPHPIRIRIQGFYDQKLEKIYS
jgi:hypothetical protein